jgi:hypothetical protein
MEYSGVYEMKGASKFGPGTFKLNGKANRSIFLSFVANMQKKM